MTTNYFTVLMLICVPVASYLIVLIWRLEKRLGGSGWLSGFLPVLLLFGVLYIFYLDDAMVGDRGIDFMRQQLSIPADVSIKTLNGGKKHSVCYRNSAYYRARAQFSPKQFSRYLAATADRKIWRPVPPTHYDAERSSFTFAGDALQWHELPAPTYNGSQQMVWKIGGEDVRRGIAFCYDIKALTGEPTAPVRDGTTAYLVTGCNAIQRSKTNSGGRLKAALDFDKQQLIIAMHFHSKAAYCNNRVTTWLNERLGVDAK